jgi:hypothetical protein
VGARRQFEASSDGAESYSFEPRQDCGGLLSVAQRAVPQVVRETSRIEYRWNFAFDLRKGIGADKYLINPGGSVWVSFGDSSMTS